MDYNVLRRRDFAGGLTDEALKIRIQDDLARDGWTLLRGFQPDMAGFAGLVGRLCRRVTFDPARSHSTDKTQMVDAGLGPIGLHIENGNTPRCPDIVCFFAERAAFERSQTTICDGVRVWDRFDPARKARCGPNPPRSTPTCGAPSCCTARRWKRAARSASSASTRCRTCPAPPCSISWTTAPPVRCVRSAPASPMRKCG